MSAADLAETEVTDVDTGRLSIIQISGTAMLLK